MPASDLTDLLGDWEGYDIRTAQRFEAGQKGPTAQVWIAAHAIYIDDLRRLRRILHARP